MEWEASAPVKQTTVYGPTTPGALDALLEYLGLGDGDVLDRIDRPNGQPSVPGLLEAVRDEVQASAAGLRARLLEIETRTARLEEERKEAAAALVEGGDDLTERKRQVLSLFVSGMTADEVAEVLDISRETVLRHRRTALKHLPSRPRSTAIDSLTERERQVASLAAEAMSLTEIAEVLFVSNVTVKRHLKQVYDKLGVASRPELIRFLRDSA